MSIRLCRLLHLQRVLAARPCTRVSDLELELGVSRRTIFRDLQTLRMAGLDVRFDSDRRGHASHGVVMTTPPNLKSLFVLLRHAAATAVPASPAERQAAESAADTLAAWLSPEQREQLDEFRLGVTPPPQGPDSDRYAAFFVAFELAAAKGRCLDVYASLPVGTPPRWHVVQPLRMSYDYDRGWRLEGLLADNHLTCRVSLGAILSLYLSERPIARRLARTKVEWTHADIEAA